MEEKKKKAQQTGMVVLILLLGLTIGEFLLGKYAYSWSVIAVPLLGISILKSFFIVRDYMHVGRVFAGDEEEGHA
jgi:hypothetical protein